MLHPNLIGHPTSVMTTGQLQPRTAVLPISFNVLYCLFAVTPRELPSWRTAIQSIVQSWLFVASVRARYTYEEQRFFAIQQRVTLE